MGSPEETRRPVVEGEAFGAPVPGSWPGNTGGERPPPPTAGGDEPTRGRAVAGRLMFVLVIAGFVIGVVHVATGDWVPGAADLFLAVMLGSITHPVRYVVDPRYRRKTERSLWQ